MQKHDIGLTRQNRTETRLDPFIPQPLDDPLPFQLYIHHYYTAFKNLHNFKCILVGMVKSHPIAVVQMDLVMCQFFWHRAILYIIYIYMHAYFLIKSIFLFLYTNDRLVIKEGKQELPSQSSPFKIIYLYTNC